MALLCYLRIPLWRLKKQSNEKLKRVTDELKALEGKIAASRKYSRKKELNAIRLNAMTKKALEKWRRQIMDEGSSNIS